MKMVIIFKNINLNQWISHLICQILVVHFIYLFLLVCWKLQRNKEYVDENQLLFIM